MKRIYKYPLCESGVAMPVGGSVVMPAGAKIVHVAMQGTAVTLWAEVPDSLADGEARTFLVAPTGGPVADDASYVGTVHQHWLVWHIYEQETQDV